LFQVVQFAKALGVAVLYIPNGEDGAAGAAILFFLSLVSEPCWAGKDFDGDKADDEWQETVTRFQAEYPDAGLNVADDLSAKDLFDKLKTAFRTLSQRG
jgi:hypothetical protein